MVDIYRISNTDGELVESVLELEVVTSCGVGSDAEIDVDDDAAVVLELCGADEAALITLQPVIPRKMS